MREYSHCMELSVTCNYLKSFDFNLGRMLAFRQLLRPGEFPLALCFIFPWLKARCPSAFGTVSLCLPGIKPVGTFGRQVINLITTYLLYAMKSFLVSVPHIIGIVERYVWTVCWQSQQAGEVSDCMIKRQNTFLANLGLSLLAKA